MRRTRGRFPHAPRASSPTASPAPVFAGSPFPPASDRSIDALDFAILAAPAAGPLGMRLVCSRKGLFFHAPDGPEHETDMPKRTDISTILIIGAGPIVIGQACEFDYSGTQAVKALKEEGYRIVLVNSNPATIMTDPELADRTYVEPITPEIVAKIIEKERPDALLPTMGGQTALNCAH